MISWNNGDIYWWSWNDNEYDKRQHEVRSGTLYWCRSRIGIVNEDHLVDTYWSNSSNNEFFSKEKALDMLDLTYVGNMSDLIKADPRQRAYYLDEDCVDLNHPNSSSGNFYVRKGAKKNLNKMKRVLQREIRDKERSIEHVLSQIKNSKALLEELTEDSNMYIDRETSLYDKMWGE
ncbi:hypothetical protein HWD03_gp115 [Alteromonas phage vB_AmeM_PT11-V22]|uniref:Uncharacterized protein n=1 Tax=Alteromonas phage vB_AmeM_PT11-V22 TaxID=2704031 RepID=A0A6C0R1R2_9CAUD|nr:hypothetical protein HWD03_gp115 [Alteromonas phage vB_AmeM_PT11-V22]QHZ59846.1 hypothetical protein [Alteromonas phage vB_AmeM_PT11-V22]